MNRNQGIVITVTMVFSLGALLLIQTPPTLLAQLDATSQQETVDAQVRAMFAATEAAQRVQQAFEQAQTATAEFKATDQTVFEQARVATAQAAQPQTNADWLAHYPDGLSFTDEKGTAMVWVPAGCYQMGGDPNAWDWGNESAPRSNGEQCLEGFYIDQYEVTNAQYVTFLTANGGNQGADQVEYIDLDDDDRRINGGGLTWTIESGYEAHPVIEVTWYGARDYCRWRGGDLPTEVQWEYASRGPSGNLFPWGNELDTSKAVFRNHHGTARVGSIESGRSWVGAYDLSGNVWEWILNDYQAYPYYTDAVSINYDNYRVLRGGSWRGSYTSDLRSSSRGHDTPGYAGISDGFRCARS